MDLLMLVVRFFEKFDVQRHFEYFVRICINSIRNIVLRQARYNLQISNEVELYGGYSKTPCNNYGTSIINKRLIR